MQKRVPPLMFFRKNFQKKNFQKKKFFKVKKHVLKLNFREKHEKKVLNSVLTLYIKFFGIFSIFYLFYFRNL